jgi:hypothetical protein
MTAIVTGARGMPARGPAAVAAPIPAVIRRPSARSGAQRRLRSWAYAASTVGSIAVLLHAWTAVTQSLDPLMTTLMLAMSFVCLPCIVAVLRRDTAHSVTMLMGMSLGCALTNLFILVGLHSAMDMDHSGAAAHVDASAVGTSAHAPLMLLVITLEMVTAGLAAVYVRRFTVPTTTRPRTGFEGSRFG